MEDVLCFSGLNVELPKTDKNKRETAIHRGLKSDQRIFIRQIVSSSTVSIVKIFLRCHLNEIQQKNNGKVYMHVDLKTYHEGTLE